MIDRNWARYQNDFGIDDRALRREQDKIADAFLRLAAMHLQGALPNETMLRELHRALMLFARTGAGRYRRCTLRVTGQRTDNVPSHPTDVARHMRGFFGALRSMGSAHVATGTPTAVAIAVYVIEELCRIHPFRDGNGRTCRAFACLVYLALTGRFVSPRRLVRDRVGWRRAFHEGHTTTFLNSLPCWSEASRIGS